MKEIICRRLYIYAGLCTITLSFEPARYNQQIAVMVKGKPVYQLLKNMNES